MKFNITVKTEDKKLHDVVEKAVADYLWAHQGEYVGKKIQTIDVTIDVTDRPLDHGCS